MSPAHSNAEKHKTKGNSKYQEIDPDRTDKRQKNKLPVFFFCLSALEYTSATTGRRWGRCGEDNSEPY